MSEPWEGWAQERALWQRWSAGGQGMAGPDALTLAAFVEGRLAGTARAEVEAFLAANPEIAEDVAAASEAAVTRAGEAPLDDIALAGVVARAAALVPARADDNIVPFRPARPPASAWPLAARWGALAASLAIVSWLGFSLGSHAYVDFAALDGQSVNGSADELLDAPSGFFGLVDTSGT